MVSMEKDVKKQMLKIYYTKQEYSNAGVFLVLLKG